MNITSDLIDSRYRIIKNIGNGSMGSVFLVHDEKLDKLWAAKLVKSITSNELIALKAVNHPAFPRLVDTVYENDYIWLIMDYIEGTSLRDYMQTTRCGRNILQSIALQLAKALDYLHGLSPSMLYLDCKPDNILIDNNGMLHLVDLGSIYLVNLSNPGRISGTAGFASPEQRLGKRVDVRSDIYSYGMTLKAISPGPDTPDTITAIIRKCSFNQATDRFQSMHEIIELLIHEKVSNTFLQNKLVHLIYGAAVSVSFTLFTIVSIYTYNLSKNIIYLILASFIFLSLMLILDRNRKRTLFTHWNCQKDIYLTRGIRSLPIIVILVVSVILLSEAPANAKEGTTQSYHSATADDYRLTLYTTKNEKILYLGQQFTINEDGSLTLSIPVSSLTYDSIPAKLELSYK